MKNVCTVTLMLLFILMGKISIAQQTAESVEGKKQSATATQKIDDGMKQLHDKVKKQLDYSHQDLKEAFFNSSVELKNAKKSVVKNYPTIKDQLQFDLNSVLSELQIVLGELQTKTPDILSDLGDAIKELDGNQTTQPRNSK